MKKFNVRNLVETADQVKGIEPRTESVENIIGDYVEADTAEEAIEIAIDWIKDQLIQNGKDFQVTEDTITVLNDNEETVERYSCFKAEEVIKD